MPNYAIIEDGKVINVAVAEEAINENWVLLPDTAGKGWDYINGQFVDNRPVPAPVPIVQPTKEELLAQINALMQQVQALP